MFTVSDLWYGHHPTELLVEGLLQARMKQRHTVFGYIYIDIVLLISCPS